MKLQTTRREHPRRPTARHLANPVLARAMGDQPKVEEQPTAALSLSTRRMAQKRANAAADDPIGYQVAVRGSPQVFEPTAEMGNKAASATWLDV